MDNVFLTSSIPAYTKYQSFSRLIAELDTKNSSELFNQFITIKNDWYQDQFYLVCLVTAHFLVAQEKTAPLLSTQEKNDAVDTITQLEAITSALGKYLSHEDLMLIVRETEKSFEETQHKLTNDQLNNFIHIILNSSLQDTCQSIDAHIAQLEEHKTIILEEDKAIFTVISKQWDTVYQILAVLGLSPAPEKTSNFKSSILLTQDESEEILVAGGKSPPTSFKEFKPKPRRASYRRGSSNTEKNLEDIISQLKGAQTDSAKELAYLKKALHQSDNEREKIKAQLDATIQALDKISSEDYQKEQTIDALQRETQTLERKAQKALQKYDQEKSQLQHLSSEIEVLRAAKKGLYNQVGQLTIENSTLKKQTTEFNTELYTLWEINQNQCQQSLETFSRNYRDYPTLIALVNEHIQTIQRLQQKQTAFYEEKKTADATIVKIMQNTFDAETRQSAIAEEIVKLEEENSSHKSILLLNQEYAVLDQSIIKSKETLDALRETCQGINQAIAATTQEMQVLRLVVEHVHSAAKQINTDVDTLNLLPLLEPNFVLVAQEKHKALEILQQTMQWIIEHLPLLTWSLTDCLYTLLDKSAQQLISAQDSASTQLKDYQILESNITSLKKQLSPLHHNIPLISKEWTSSMLVSTINISTQDAYIPYDFYQIQNTAQSLVFQENIELKIHPLQENTVQLDLFYIGSDKNYIRQVQDAILSLTQSIVAHTEIYPNLEIEVEINNDTPYAQELINALYAYQTIYIGLGKTPQIKLINDCGFDAKIMTEKKQAILPLEQAPLSEFYGLLKDLSIITSDLKDTLICP